MLAQIGADAGTALTLTVRDGAIVAEPVQAPVQRRYTLAELLDGAKHLPAVYAGVPDALDGEPAGREIS